MPQKISIKEFDDYEYCQICHNPFPHCHCKCRYCGERDSCEVHYLMLPLEDKFFKKYYETISEF